MKMSLGNHLSETVGGNKWHDVFIMMASNAGMCRKMG